MSRKLCKPSRKILSAVIIITFLAVAGYQFYSLNLDQRMSKALEKYENKYLVDLPGCRIRDVDPFDDVIMKDWHEQKWYENWIMCNDKRQHIFEAEVVGERTCPRINQRILQAMYHSTTLKLNCTYQEVIVDTSQEIRDSSFKLLDEHYLGDSCPEEMFIWISCRIGTDKYEQPLFMTKVLPAKKPVIFDSSAPRPYHVLVLGVDSVSRLQFHRNMQGTYHFLKSKYGDRLIELKGYNKVGENTAPNEIPLLSGTHFDTETDMTDGQYFDNFTRYLWQDYRDRGYRTLFFEESVKIGLFTYPGRHGFFETPTDYWPRPLTNKDDSDKYSLFDSVKPCQTDYQPTKYTLDFIQKTLKVLGRDRPLFSYTWLVEATHDLLSGARNLDPILEEFFNNMNSSHLLEDTMIFFISDHGYRMGPYRTTPLGQMEDRLPFGFILPPKTFGQDYPKAFHSLKVNSKRLVTSYDLHATLLDLLDISTDNLTNTTTHALSLISNEIPEARTCSDANIEPRYCACYQAESRSKSSPDAKHMAEIIVNKVNSILTKSNAEGCSKFILYMVTRLDELYSGASSTDLFQVSLEAHPGPSTFEAVVKKTKQGISLASSVIRIDRYSTHSQCASEKLYERYCYCK